MGTPTKNKKAPAATETPPTPPQAAAQVVQPPATVAPQPAPMPPQVGQFPGMMQPGMNPMMAMMGMFQQMAAMGGMGMPMPGVDPSAVPFAQPAAQVAPVSVEADKGLDAGIIRPARLAGRLKNQDAVKVGSVLDLLCLTPDGKHALGGLPKGCTIAFAGPPGTSKTRTSLAALANVARTGEKVAFVVAEEGFHDTAAGRDDLCSRLCKIGMAVTGLDEAKFEKEVLERLYVVQAQYHRGTTWDDFVTKYRYLIEKEKVGFVVIDSLNMLDPARTHTADNLSALKTYNHEAGVTAVCIGQIRDSGEAVGGEALAHTADVFFHLEKFSLGSKEIAATWGGQYRDQLDVITCKKSVTTPRFPYMVRVNRDANGILIPHAAQPSEFALLPPK